MAGGGGKADESTTHAGEPASATGHTASASVWATLTPLSVKTRSTVKGLSSDPRGRERHAETIGFVM